MFFRHALACLSAYYGKRKAVNLFLVRFTTFVITITTMMLLSYRNTVP